MVKSSKRMQKIRESITHGGLMDVIDAFKLLKELSEVKFVESVDVSVNLGIDPKKSEQAVRGAAVLPNGTGREVKVAVFAQAAKADVVVEVEVSEEN